MQTTEKTAEQAVMLVNRITKNRRRLKGWLKRSGVTCYRLYDRDIPELPLVFDWYAGHLHVAEYDRPSNPEGEAHTAWIGALTAAVAESLQVSSDDVFVKFRNRQRGTTQYQRFSDREARFKVSESGLNFWVNLSDYLDTGLFLDHRPMRQMVRAEAADKRLLNLYAYTASFSVYAAAGGAAETVSVDLSNTYLDWAAHNFEANNMTKSDHRLVRDDVMDYLHTSLESEQRFDLVVVDPPTFSNSKRMQGTFDVGRDHVALLEAVQRVLTPGGVVYFSTNARRFDWQGDSLDWAGCKEITDQTIPEDFRQRRSHRCWRLVAE